MADTKIEWADKVWNPIAGCNDKSEGCRNCYARGMARRLELMGQEKYKGLTVLQGSHVVWTGKIAFDEGALLQPLSWKKPRRVFVNSMSDLFHENVSDELRDRIFAVMFAAGRHTFQVLTKRPERMEEYFNENNPRYTARKIVDAAAKMGISDHVFDCDIYFPLMNVWLGVSVENQTVANARIPALLRTPAAVRFISAEPLLGPLDLTEIRYRDDDVDCLWNSLTAYHEVLNSNSMDIVATADDGVTKLDWVICGGESGPGARPMHPDWARSLRDQCAAAGSSYFFKQWGEWAPGECVDATTGTVQTATWFDSRWIFDCANLADDEGHRDDEPDLYRIGKHVAGAHLDGREWKQFPGVR